MRGINTTLCSLRGEPEGRRHSSTLESLHWCSAMISLLSQMSGLYEAPEDIFNAQDHCLRPERACRNVTFYFRPHTLLLSDKRNESLRYRMSRARGIVTYMPITASAPTMLIDAAAHCAPTSDESVPMNIPPTNSTTWVI